MKERTKGNKDTSEGDEDESIDNAGYRDLPTVGVSHPTHPFHKEYIICVQVFCNDCDELVQLVIHERGLAPQDCDVHVGFDGGQGLLKIGFTVTERCEEVSLRSRSKYSEVCQPLNGGNKLFCQNIQGVASKAAKSSSVKKLQVLGAVADVPENYHNIKVILNQLNIEALQFTVSADVKMCKFI